MLLFFAFFLHTIETSTKMTLISFVFFPNIWLLRVPEIGISCSCWIHTSQRHQKRINSQSTYKFVAGAAVIVVLVCVCGPFFSFAILIVNCISMLINPSFTHFHTSFPRYVQCVVELLIHLQYPIDLLFVCWLAVISNIIINLCNFLLPMLLSSNKLTSCFFLLISRKESRGT